jgi:hypothetical protein
VYSRLETLQLKLDTQQWSEDCTSEYELLDKVITESMLSAQKVISRCITTTYRWLPTLKKAVYSLRYWLQRL